MTEFVETSGKISRSKIFLLKSIRWFLVVIYRIIANVTMCYLTNRNKSISRLNLFNPASFSFYSRVSRNPKGSGLNLIGWFFSLQTASKTSLERKFKDGYLPTMLASKNTMTITPPVSFNNINKVYTVLLLNS